MIRVLVDEADRSLAVEVLVVGVVHLLIFGVVLALVFGVVQVLVVSVTVFPVSIPLTVSVY